MMTEYFVLKVKDFEIYFNSTSMHFYKKETWNKSDEHDWYSVGNATKWDINDIDMAKRFKKCHPNIDKNFEIVKIVEFSIKHYFKEKYDE